MGKVLDITKTWKDASFVALDIETSGKYPLQAEICEIAAVKWEAGKVVEEYQTLVRPTEPMGDFVIGIHGITNEMVIEAPPIEDVIFDFIKFCEGSVVMAHHAPFDLGFLSIELEAKNLPVPTLPAICTSLLARNVVKNTPNHKLQTLAEVLKLDAGVAHRALSDASACWQLGLHCMQKLGEDVSLSKVLDKQGGALYWKRFGITGLVEENKHAAQVISAIRQKKELEVVYLGGTQKGKWRTIEPVGLVRSLNGDFFLVKSNHEHYKRFMFSKLVDARFLAD